MSFAARNRVTHIRSTIALSGYWQAFVRLILQISGSETSCEMRASNGRLAK